MGLPAIVVAIIQVVASTAMSLIFTSLLADGSKQPDDIGANITKSGTKSPRSPIYGTCRIPSTRVWSNVRDDHASQLISVYGCGIGEIEAIHQVFIDDIPVIKQGNYKSDPNGGNNQLIINGVGDFAIQNVKVQLRTGLDHENPMSLAIDNSDGEWTTKHRGDRVVQCAVLVSREIENQQARILSSDYSLSLLVSGAKLFDPRTMADPMDRTKFKFSRNPSLALLDYITDKYYGLGIPYKFIDLNSFIEMANYCDQMRFYIDGVVESDNEYSKNLTNILSTFSGILIAENGFVKVKADHIEIPSHHFNEDNIYGGNINVTNNSTSNYYNCVEVRFKAGNQKEKADTFTIPSDLYNDPRILRDGYIKSKSFDMPLTIDGYDGQVLGAVKTIANLVYNKALYQKEVSFKYDMDEAKLGIYDVIEVSNEHYGWVRKKFKIQSIKKTLIDENNFNMGEISATEYSDDIYGGMLDGEIGKPNKPQEPLTPPSDLVFNLITYITNGYGELSWQNTMFAPSMETQVEYKLETDKSWSRLGETKGEMWKVANLRVGRYIFRVRSVHPLRGASDWTISAVYEISPTVIFPEVTGLSVDVKTQDFIVTWTDMLPHEVGNPVIGADGAGSDNTVGTFFSHYDINIYHFNGAAYDYKQTISSSTNSLVYKFADNIKNGLNRNVKFEVIIVAKDGTRSTTTSNDCKIEATNPQMPTPSGLEILSKVGMVFCNWEEPTVRHPDYTGTVIHISDTANFAPDISNQVFDGVGSYIYYWEKPQDYDPNKVYAKYVKIGHYDAFGSDNINYSPEETVMFQSIDHAVTPFDPTDLENAIDQNRQDIAVAKDKLNHHDTQLNDLDKTLIQHEQDIDILNRDLLALGNEMDGLGQDLNEANNKITSNQQAIRDNATVITNLETDLSTLDQELSQTSQNVSNVEKELAELDKELDGVLPTVSHDLAQLRNPDNAPIVNGNRIDTIMNVVSSHDKTRTAGYALVARNTSNDKRSQFIIAADELIIGGGRGFSNTNNTSLVYYNASNGKFYIQNAAIRELTSSNIKAGSITASSIASNAITAGKINAGAVTAREIKAGTITATQIATDTITSTNIAAGAITASEIATNAITAIKVAANAITAGKIAADAVTAREIRADSVTANEIAARTITANEIAVDTILANNIAAGAITASEIATNAITAIKIAAGAITTDKLAAGSVVADKIGTNAITANHIQAGAVNASKLSANSVETNHIVAGAITAAKIQAGSITGDRINASTRINIGSVSGHFCGVSGVSGDFGFWAGASSKSSNGGDAPFRVDRNGTCYANKLILGGTIPKQITDAQSTANSAQSTASNAQSTANSAQSTANGLESKMYVNQSKVQIMGNYRAGSTGWAIDSNGNAEFNNVTMRGTVYATNGWFKGTVYANKIEGDIFKGHAVDQQEWEKFVPPGGDHLMRSFDFGVQPFTRTLYIPDIRVGSQAQAIRIHVNGQYTTAMWFDGAQQVNQGVSITLPANRATKIDLYVRGTTGYTTQTIWVRKQSYLLSIWKS